MGGPAPEQVPVTGPEPEVPSVEPVTDPTPEAPPVEPTAEQREIGELNARIAALVTDLGLLGSEYDNLKRNTQFAMARARANAQRELREMSDQNEDLKNLVRILVAATCATKTPTEFLSALEDVRELIGGGPLTPDQDELIGRGFALLIELRRIAAHRARKVMAEATDLLGELRNRGFNVRVPVGHD